MGLFGYINKRHELKIEEGRLAEEHARTGIQQQSQDEIKRNHDLENWRSLQTHALSNIDAQLAKMRPTSPGFEALYKMRGRIMSAVPNDPNNAKLWDDYGQHHQVHDDHVEGLNELMNGSPGKPTGQNIVPAVGQTPGSDQQSMSAPTAPFVPPSSQPQSIPPVSLNASSGLSPQTDNSTNRDAVTRSPVAPGQGPYQSAFVPPEGHGHWLSDDHTVKRVSPNGFTQEAQGHTWDPGEEQVQSRFTPEQVQSQFRAQPQGPQMRPGIAGNGLPAGSVGQIPSIGPAPDLGAPQVQQPARQPQARASDRPTDSDSMLRNLRSQGLGGVTQGTIGMPIRQPSVQSTFTPGSVAQPAGNPVAGGAQIKTPSMTPQQMQQAGAPPAPPLPPENAMQQFMGAATGQAASANPAGQARMAPPQVRAETQQGVGVPPVMHAQSDPLSSDPIYQMGLRDYRTDGYTSPDIQAYMQMVGQHITPEIFKQRQMQTGIEHLKESGAWDKLPPHIQANMEFEAYGGKSVSLAPGLMTPYNSGTSVAGDQAPQGQLDAYGRPVHPGWDYHVVTDKLSQQQTWQPIGPKTFTGTDATGHVNEYNKRTGESTNGAGGAPINTAMASTQSTTDRIVNNNGNNEVVPMTTTRTRVAPGGVPPVGGAGTPGAGGGRVLGSAPSKFKMEVENPYTPAGQKILQATDQTRQNIDKALALLNNGKDDNMPMSKGLETMLYKLGISTEGSNLINTLNIADLQAASAILPPGQRSLQVLSKALEHTPNTKFDSQKLMREKLENIKRNLDEAQSSVKRYMVKNPGLVRENMPEPPSSVSGKGPAVGTVEGGYKFKGGDPAVQSNWVKQ